MKRTWRWLLAGLIVLFLLSFAACDAIAPAEFDRTRLAHPTDIEWVKIEDVSPHLVNAIIATEDQDFERHNGIDFQGIARNVVAGFEGHPVHGGSTITMQLAKNLEPAPSRRTLGQLYLGWVNARRLEHTLSKNEILEQYVNRVYYGNELVGIDAAARGYFGKSPKDLSIAESAVLAGVLKAPSVLNPEKFPQKALTRRDYVLDRMSATGRETSSAVAVAKAEPLGVR